MNIITTYDSIQRITGYSMRITAEETVEFAQQWPCSRLRGRAVSVAVDSNGLVDLSPRPDDLESAEVEALVSMYLPDECKHLWPDWGRHVQK